MITRILLAAMLVGALAAPAYAQRFNRDFYNYGGVALYNPEIGLVMSGPLLVARPIVSADRKYVTMGVQAQITQVVRIEQFPVAGIGYAGFVGGARPVTVSGGAGAADTLNSSAPVRVRQAGSAPVLSQPGITWIAPP